MLPPTELFYDRNNDVLYVSIGKPRSSISRELVDGVLVRADLETRELTGLTIMNLSSRYGNMNDPQSIPIGMLLSHLA